MKYEEYTFTASEIAQLEDLLDKLPDDMVIERMGLEARLEKAKSRIADVPRPQAPKRAYLPFRGKPVLGSSGIAADFGASALTMFTDAVTIAAAGFSGRLADKGPVPDRERNRPIITGVATGSFGFELEIPGPDYVLQSEGQPALPSKENPAEEALIKIQELLMLSCDGTDDALSVLADEIHPRAVRKVVEFLELMQRNDAWFSLQYGDKKSRFNNSGQVKRAAERLNQSNIHEHEEDIPGEIHGLLPNERRFELQRAGDGTIIRGKLGREITDAPALLREHLGRTVVARLTSVRVGQGAPRYTLRSVRPSQPL